MANLNKITVRDVNIRTIKKDGVDYISLTDIAKQKNTSDPNGVIGNWIRNRITVEYLGLWEVLHNLNFNPLEFQGFRKHARKGRVAPPWMFSQRNNPYCE